MPASIVLTAIYGSTFMAAASLGAIGLAAATFAINFAVSYIVGRAFLGKAKTQANGVRQQVPPSTDNRIPVVYGEAWLGGAFVDAVISTDQQTMYYVMAISHISPDGQFSYDTTKFYYGDRLVTFGTGAAVASLTDDAGNVDTKIAGYLDINLYTSSQSGVITTVRGSAPNVVMGGSDIASGFRWPASGRQMNGLAFAIVKLKYNTDAGTTGLQPLTFKVAHTLNGSGAAKPGSVLKDYLSNDVYGGAVPLANINTTACAALDSYADETITFTPVGGGSSTQSRYRINGVLDTGETVLNNVDHILMACDSWISYQAETGQWAPIINKAEDTAFIFNDSNIIGDIRVSATDITQSINQVEASFPFKGNKDQPGTVLIETPSGLLYPNEPVNKYTTTFNLVNDSVQAQYLANRMLEQAREDLIVSFSTAYTGIQVNAGEVVAVTNAAYGWESKLFRVMKVTETSLPDGNLGARFELNEYNAQVYDNFTINEFTPAPNSGLQSGYYFPDMLAPTFADQVPAAVPPTFSVVCQLPTTVRATTVILYYTTSTTPTQADWKVWAIQTGANNTAFPAGLSLKFPNVTVGSGTYYFAFAIANDVSTSQLSATSAAFSWAPVGVPGPEGPQGETGATGDKSATVTVYKWDITIPAGPTGSSTYTWADGTFTPNPTNGWGATISSAPSPGYTLWAASKIITASYTATTSTISWTGATIVSAGYAGEQGPKGLSSRICFARVANNPAPVSGTITTSGGTSFPSSTQSSTTWGFAATWGSTDPNPSSTNSLYQSDGIYDPVANQTVWSTPYISSLKVGSLSAITVNTGTLTVGTDGNIKGGQTDYATGTGFFLGYSGGAYKFSVGGSTNFLRWNGSALSISGQGTFYSTVNGNNYASLGTDTSGSVVRIYKTDASNLPPFYVYDTALYGAIQAAWIRSDNNPALRIDSGDIALAVISTNAGETIAKPLVDVIGSRQESQLRVQAKQTTGLSNQHAARFYAFNTSNAVVASGIASTQSGYAYYAETGTIGPFTGAHDGLIAKTAIVEPGDILVDDGLVAKKDISNTLFKVTASTQPNSPAIGIYVSSSELSEKNPPAAFIASISQEPVFDADGNIISEVTKYELAPEFAAAQQDYDMASINALGEGQINVCGEGGDIQPGDLIVTSSIAGKGMKQADDLIRSYTVARAREAATFAPGEVKQIACIYLCG